MHLLHTLENSTIKIKASTCGGELHNLILKENEIEYLWNRDPKYWKYSSPILFPIVGKVTNSKIIVDGKSYEIPPHGIGRISDYEVTEKTEDSITFELKYSNETLKMYPFKFSLKIKYTLIENGVKVTYIVTNLDDKTMYFSIGGHPAFLCPIGEDEKFTDYYLEFNKKETADIMGITEDGFFDKTSRKPYLNNENIIDITDDLFVKDNTIVFDTLKSNVVSLKSKVSNKSVTMDFDGFPYMAFWSKATGSPFVCIEPWYGHGDFYDFNGEFKDKDGVRSLDVNDSFECSYTITLSK